MEPIHFLLNQDKVEETAAPGRVMLDIVRRSHHLTGTKEACPEGDRATVERLETNQVRVHCLALGGVDLASAAGKMTMQVIAAVAEFERDLLIERTQSDSSRPRPRQTFGSTIPVERRATHSGITTPGRWYDRRATVAKEFATSRQTILRVRDAMTDGAP